MKVIIFDFDGTIADSFDLVLAISNRLAIEYGFPQVNPEEAHRLQDLSSREIVRQSGVSLFRLPFLLLRLRKELNQEIRYLKPIEGIQTALLTLKHRGYHLGIVTSNSRENVQTFLTTHNLAGLFDFIGSGLTLFGKGKVIQRIIRRHQFDPAMVIYVGDETRDVEAARKIRIKVIAVGWGFSSRQVLAEHQPDRLIHQPGELITAVESIFG